MISSFRSGTLGLRLIPLLTCLLFGTWIVKPCGAVPGAADNSSSDLNPLTQQLKSTDESARVSAAKQLGESGQIAAIPPLAAALTDPSTKVRKEVILALAQFRNAQSLAALLTATKDTDPTVRTFAVEAAVSYYTANLPSLGVSGFLKRNYNRAKSKFSGGDTRIDPGIQVNPSVITALIAAMQDTRSIAPAREAARGLGILVARPAVPDLVVAAHSTDVGLAVNAVVALAKIEDITAGPKLVDLLGSPDKDVKVQAALTTGILRAQSAVPKLQAMVQNDQDKDVREAALQGLAYIGDTVSLPIFIKALWNNEKADRTYAAEGMARAGDKKALPELERRSKVEKDAGVKLAMAFAFAALGQQSHLKDLVNGFDSRTHADEAQTYLIELTRNKTYLQEMYPLMASKSTRVRQGICGVLMYTGDASSITPLDHLTRDRNSNVAAEALRALNSVRARTNLPAAGTVSERRSFKPVVNYRTHESLAFERDTWGNLALFAV
ncbi:MAG TPA: HEAT repeat domain-containing protein [Terriglobia bacterium]|nr:HEAT repeat domain-containing protein [Terriglobia bacterium]